MQIEHSLEVEAYIEYAKLHPPEVVGHQKYYNLDDDLKWKYLLVLLYIWQKNICSFRKHVYVFECKL